MLEYRHSWGTAQDAPCYSTPCVACVKGSTGVRIQTPPPGPMLKASGMYRRSRRLCGQGRRRHEEGVVDIRESPLTEARRSAEPEKARAQGRRPETCSESELRFKLSAKMNLSTQKISRRLAATYASLS